MQLRLACLFALVLAIAACTSEKPKTLPKVAAMDRWVAYYNDTLPASAFAEYDLVVFDREHHPDFSGLLGQSKRPTILAYVSMGEVHGHEKALRAMLREEGAILGKNERWNSYIVDITHPIWHAHLLDELLPDVVAQGFDGVMLDTLDSALHAEGQDKAELYLTAVQLIREIRARYPQMRIMLNRGYEILPYVANSVDYALAESVYFSYDPATNVSTRQPSSATQPFVDILQQARANAPKLQVFTLDYWHAEDSSGIFRVYKEQRGRGFIPYVATPDLRQLVPEPGDPAKHTPQPTTSRSNSDANTGMSHT